ncbi:MAG: hypothetical protein RL386_407 [Bacteroidota bacterium]|jgi:NAD+ kinase
MQVVVFSKIVKEKDQPYFQHLFDALHQEGILSYVYRPLFHQLKDKVDFRRDVGIFEGYIDFSLKKFDAVIVLGGDGTILSAITHIRDAEIPVMGINLGRLGFLAGIEKKRIGEAISHLYRGRYWLDQRVLLYLESNLPLFGNTRFALNDCTLLKRDTSSMITIHAYVNGAYLNSYWADGLIIATPTGSTGYSLSCGGPIVFPRSGNFIITPVAPHNLNARPVVISDDSIVSFELEGRTENFLCTLDSRVESITTEHQLALRKNDFGVRLIQLQDISFMETLRNKLSWGIDSRNY